MNTPVAVHGCKTVHGVTLSAIPEIVAALQAWKCASCGGRGEYEHHGQKGEFRRTGKARLSHPKNRVTTCKRCGGHGLEPVAREALIAAGVIKDGPEDRARAAGWEHGGDNGGFWFHKDTWGTWKSAVSWSGTDQEPKGKDDHPTLYDTAEELCKAEGL